MSIAHIPSSSSHSNSIIPLLHLSQSPFKISTRRLPRRRIMASADTDTKKPAGFYPMPISPPYPALSKAVELHRAMSAAARSGAFALSSKHIIFEDDWFVVVNKPSGIYCETLLPSLASPSRQCNLHLANRLDRDTSGLMIVTKSNKVAAELVKAFTHHKIKKTYLAFCVGRAPIHDKIRISSGHGRSKFGAWRVYSVSDIGRVLPGGSLVKSMATSFEVLSVNGKAKLRDPDMEPQSVAVEEQCHDCGGIEGEAVDEVLVRTYPESGRTHQIRLHCQHLGFPIRGDVKYGGVHVWKGVDCDFHDLHAESISFEHPVTGSPVFFRAPSPSWEQLIVKVAVTEKDQRITKSHTSETVINEDDDPALRPLNSEKPKRKLLPASVMLLKDFSGLVMDENAKEIKRKKAVNLEGRSQGSNSLIRILKSNLPR